MWVALAVVFLGTFVAVLIGASRNQPSTQARRNVSAPATHTIMPSPSASALPRIVIPTLPAPEVTLTAKPHHGQQPTGPGIHHQHGHGHGTPPVPTLDFTISSFNTLGSSHTKHGGTHARFAPGPVRARWASAVLSLHGVDVAGLQEFQTPQLGSFLRATRGAFGVYPGYSLGARGAENSIVWRKSEWSLVSANSVEIPYFNGNRRPMPVVLLKNQATGIEAYFANFHNPADTGRFHHQQRWRNLATTIEIRLVNHLLKLSDVPVFLTGDMNERAQYFCRLTGSTPMVAASGGSNSGGCHPPRPIGIDWIFGSPNVHFFGYLKDKSSLIRRTTDHSVVFSHVSITGSGSAQ
jgi:hypothetical protein